MYSLGFHQTVSETTAHALDKGHLLTALWRGFAMLWDGALQVGCRQQLVLVAAASGAVRLAWHAVPPAALPAASKAPTAWLPQAVFASETVKLSKEQQAAALSADAAFALLRECEAAKGQLAAENHALRERWAL